MRRNLLFTLLLCLFFSLTTFAQEKESLLPKNDWSIPRLKSLMNVPEAEVLAMVEKFKKSYIPIVAAQGAKLSILVDFKNTEVNAYAYREPRNSWIVSLLGGIIRHPKMTADALALVLCHELGHHLGGAPRKNEKFGPGPDDYPSNEGQSDYFAGLKCFRQIFEHDDNEALLQGKFIPSEVQRDCEASYSFNTAAYFLCARSALAAHALSLILSGGKVTSFSTPAKNQVTKTNDNHPAGQCRLDTYFAGALCTVEGDLDRKNPEIGTCHDYTSTILGNRPLCWFKPAKS